MGELASILEVISGWIWGIPLAVLLMGTHLFLTIRLRFMQRYIFQAIKISFTRNREGAGDISHFGALATALAATIGTGNIVGVATAIVAGGPGAVFWMWLTGILGIATKYAEAVLAIKYRVTNSSGRMAGGPMYALEFGLGMRRLAVLFATFTAIAGFGIGNMVQSNSIATLLHDSAGITPWVTGAALATLTAAVILGGIRWIARACALLVPGMAVIYVVGCFMLMAQGWSTLGDTIVLILKSAFTGQAAIGGFTGAGMAAAIRYGIARGLFSNESGLGSAPIVAAAAQTKNSVRQALVSSTGTFWDTVIVCAITGITLVNSGEWMTPGLDGALLTKAAFAKIPAIGPAVLTVGLLTFVFSTILGWSYYGEKSVEYLFGRTAIKPYRCLWVAAILVGSVLSIPVVWSLADIANALMALPNLVALLLLSKVVVAETKEHLWNEIGLSEGGGRL